MLLDLTYRGARMCPCLDKGVCLGRSAVVKVVEVKGIRRAIDRSLALVCGALFVVVVLGYNWLVFRDVWSISRCVVSVFVAPLWLCHCPIYFESNCAGGASGLLCSSILGWLWLKYLCIHHILSKCFHTRCIRLPYVAWRKLLNDCPTQTV